MTDRSYHHGNLRAALLARAWDVIDEDGAEALSLRGLARDVGVSHGASARHFRDRQALLDAIALEGFERMNRSLAEAVGTDASFPTRLRAAGRAYVEFAVAHPAILGVMYSAKQHEDASAELLEESHAGMRGLIDLIEEGQAAGQAKGGGPARLALVAFASVHGVAALATADLLDGVPWEEAAEAVLAFLAEGIDAGSAAFHES
ncbi:TetR/AcrR family transcriptional regulator [Microbacterium sp. 4R-513]|uniref:TetR/AcrR family transcriptional regulator n=1 Tax=Microbacterium sp. 4R-513 TaxID=2567934 RepID=UPI0013E16864|nr:TetR/AcrR family transcriptional regulator [Microbacterium sp. 4R-513]QIG40850.1 TetR/AcrR family transcriptional regulator [Microbacterium sp. 4R-513]